MKETTKIRRIVVMGKITKNYIYNILFQMITLFAPLFVSPFLTRVLGAEQLGVYSFVTSSANVIVTIGLLGTYNYGCQQVAYYRDDELKCSDVYRQIYSFRLILGIVISVAYFVVTTFEVDYRKYFIIYYTWVLSMIVDPSWFFVGQEEMKATALKNSAIKIITIVLIFAFVRNEMGLITYVGIMGGTALLCNLLLYSQLRNYHVSHRVTTENIKNHLKGSLALFWPQVASLFYLQVDKIMLRYLSGDISNVSYYDYGEKIVTIPLTIITTLSTVMMPRIANEYAKNNHESVRNLLIKAGGFSLMLAMPMMVGMAVCANKLIPWYLGDAYSPSILVIILLSPLILTNSLAGISGTQYLVATNQTNLLLKAYVSAAVCNVIINAATIPFLGCRGAAVATIISSTISVIIQYYYMHKQVGVKEYLMYGIRYFVYSIPVGIVAFVIGLGRDATPVVSLLQVIGGCAVYGIILLATKDRYAGMILGKAKSLMHKRIKRK